MKFTTIVNFSLTTQQITSCFHTPHLLHSETVGFFCLFVFFKSKEKAHVTYKQSQKYSVSTTGIFLGL